MLKQVTYFTWVHKERWEYLVSWSHTENVLLIHFGAQKRKMNWCLLSHTWVEYVLGLKCCLSLQKSSHSFNFILRMNKNETLWNLNSVYPFRTRFYTFCFSLLWRFSFGLYGSSIRANTFAHHHKMNISAILSLLMHNGCQTCSVMVRKLILNGETVVRPHWSAPLVVITGLFCEVSDMF